MPWKYTYRTLLNIMYKLLYNDGQEIQSSLKSTIFTQLCYQKASIGIILVPVRFIHTLEYCHICILVCRYLPTYIGILCRCCDIFNDTLLLFKYIFLYVLNNIGNKNWKLRCSLFLPTIAAFQYLVIYLFLLIIYI